MEPPSLPMARGPLGIPACFYMQGWMTDDRSVDVMAVRGSEMTASGSLLGTERRNHTPGLFII